MKHRHKHIKSKLRHLKPKKNLLLTKEFWFSVLGAVLVGTLVYFVFFFPKFQIQTVGISGNQKVATGDIETIAWNQINKNILGVDFKNMMMVDFSAMKKNLLTGFPVIEEVKITHNWFQNINLEITERKPIAVFCPNKSIQNCFFIDRHGVIFERVDDGAAPLSGVEGRLAVRQAFDESKLTTGKSVVDSHIMEAIVKVSDTLENNFQINVREALSSNPLIFTTSEGWQIYFDPTQDINMQITKLDLLLKNEITPAIRQNLQYIYLQYKDRAYYK